MKKKKLPQIRDLNNQNFCASSFKLFLSLFCFISRYSFLEFLRKSFNKLFGLLKRQTRQSSNGFNHRNPRVTRNLINHNIELRLLLHGSRCGNNRNRSKGGGVTPSLSWRYSTSFCASARVRFEISSPSSTTFPSAMAATRRRNVDRWESLGVRSGNSRVFLGERLREMQLEWWRRKDRGEASMIH
ncbi:unnamed protein product [Lactuca virosa]|uniref:Uncharacterized protein n=1 Tax=Lactuca virosa TaxID=75947 RepID=A0AAU9N6K1_9ASTR|nr:unnamed protein product [Lactuca virosa]